MQKVIKFFKDDDGVVMIEYALIGALIGVALIVTLVALADELNIIFHRIIDALASA